ncbi:MAG TPA: 1-deoxy-D-xylulose-5-phosphate synthase [Clostridia bacterium]|nr:1-deoxy-D-xylulose-5-phosphate synthase [Clostridia bacterium]
MKKKTKKNQNLDKMGSSNEFKDLSLKENSILNKVDFPSDLKKLNYKEKIFLAEEIRKLIIKTVAKNGGHLASNLGVTELTIALHSVYNTPSDKIIWDVGHQTYVHKILTGRKTKMDSLRKLNGLAGFPKTEESEYDVFNTGHSSTSISAALGIARARDIKGEQNKVIAVIGDGALTGGMAHEALNDLGTSKSNVIVILNDNEMSIEKNVGGVAVLLSKLRTKKFYTATNVRIKNLTLKIPVFGKFLVDTTRRIKSSIKQIFISKMYFEDIGFTYLGPVDGHNIEVLENILKKANDVHGPVLLHVITKKGKGYGPAEVNPDKFHSTPSFDISTGKSLKEKKNDYSKVFGDKLCELARIDKKIVAITAAMADGTGLENFKKIFPDRIFDVGIAEQHALCCAAGMAKNGLKPVVSLYSSFYQRAYDQIIHDIAIQNLPVVMCVDRAGIVGNDGETHQGLMDMSMFNLVPNLTIMAPKDFAELEKMIEFAIELNKPVILRYPRGSEGTIKFDNLEEIKFAKAEIIKKFQDDNIKDKSQLLKALNVDFENDNKNVQNNDDIIENEKNLNGNNNKIYETDKQISETEKITIIAIGKMVEKAVKLSEKMININSEIINARFLKPIDEETIINSIKKSKNVVTIEDGILRGGLATTILELIQKNDLKDINVKNYGYNDVFVQHGSIEELENLNGMNF